MHFIFNSASLNLPTLETAREYASKRFSKLDRFFPKFEGEPLVRISFHKEKHLFVVRVQISIPQKLIISVSDTDLRKALDDAYATLKTTILKLKSKRVDKYHAKI